MSWDLEVVTHRRPVIEDVRAVLGAGVECDGTFDAKTGSASVSRLSRGVEVPLFTIDGPFRVELDDIEHFGAAVVAPEWLLEFSVPEGAATSNRTLAKRVATHIAKATGGAVYDPQDDQVVWPIGARRPRARPQPGAPTGKVRLEWCGPPSHLAKAGAGFLAQARVHLPEALPTRFGPHEPFQYRLGEDDREFIDAWNDEATTSGSLFWRASAPCRTGSASWPFDNAANARRGGVAAANIRMDLDLRALSGADTRWRSAAVDLFRAIAIETKAFYGRGIVEYSPDEMTAGELYSLGLAPAAVWRGRWHGIPARPAWLTWLGRGYTRATGLQFNVPRKGHFMQLCDDPADACEMPDLPEVLLRRRRSGRQSDIETLSGPGLDFRDANQLISD